MNQIDVLDHGFVRLIDSMGTDLSIVRAARVSYNAAWRAGTDDTGDRKLLRRLWTGGKKRMPEVPKHSTPFEAVTVTLEVQAPIFVFRQWHRHRTQSYNEVSARYTELPEVYYVPIIDSIGIQSEKNKQARVVGHSMADALKDLRMDQLEEYTEHCKAAFDLYRSLLEGGWPRELARMCLPLSTYSHMFATANLLNWMKFLCLRADGHAQMEIKVYADAIATLLEPIVPHTVDLWREAMIANAE